MSGAASTLSAVSTNVTSHAQKLTSQSAPAASLRCFHVATSKATAKMAVSSSSINGSGSCGADEIRCKLLYKLGIYDDGSSANKTAPSVPPGAAEKSSSSGRRAVRRVRQWTPPRALPSSTDTASTPSSSTSLSLLGDAVPFSVPLKQNNDNDDTHTSAHNNDTPQEQNNNNSNNSKSKRPNKIAFDTKVSVLPIPLHSDYSRRLRTRLWSGRHEIRHNAARNSIEFAAEGWDWRTVTEDEQMFVCAVSGELVHPVHCRYSRNRLNATTMYSKSQHTSTSFSTRMLAHQQHYRQQQQQLLQLPKQSFAS